MRLGKNIVCKIVICFAFSMTVCLSNISAQICSGTWALNHILSQACLTGQWIGYQNPTADPAGCPANPVYMGVQINTFSFANPVSGFIIDFKGFDASPGCARLELRINGSFYPLTTANLINFLQGSGVPCELPPTNITATSDGYLTSTSSNGGSAGIMINNVYAESVTVSTNDRNGISVGTPRNCLSIVPIKLKTFAASANNCKATLTWETGMESNVKNIELLRSHNGILFEKAGDVIPKGNNSHYAIEIDNYKDAYFKLRTNDFDGHYGYSKIISLKSNCKTSVYTVSPNPAGDVMEVKGLTTGDQLQLLDIAGKMTRKYNFTHTNKFDLQNLAPGIYIVQVINATTIKVTLRVIHHATH